MKTCQHYYWDTNIRHRYRICKFCRLRQFYFDKKWEDELKIEHFLGRWFQEMDGSGVIEFKYIFEYQCYESWGLAMWIIFPENALHPWFYGENYEYFKELIYHPFAGKKFGPYHNFNQANYSLNQELEKIKKEKIENI